MLSEKDFQRIVKEMDRLKNVDIVKYIQETSPWFNVLESTILRAVRILDEKGIFYVLYGLRPLPLYGVPYISKEINFAIKVDGEEGFVEQLQREGFRKVAKFKDELEFLDLQRNRRVVFTYSPKPLEWDDELIKRAIKKMDVRILSVEDFAASLLSKRESVMMAELAAKVIYANMDEIDLDYLKMRASRLKSEDRLEAILEGLKKASSR